jgi:hypothetical protein
MYMSKEKKEGVKVFSQLLKKSRADYWDLTKIEVKGFLAQKKVLLYYC